MSDPLTNPSAPTPAGAGLNRDEICFTLFRHKWLIAGFVLLGLAGALVVRELKPPFYVSKAKLMVPYVLDPKWTNPSNVDETVISTDAGADILTSEMHILTSLDVATNVATIVGPARILAPWGGGSDPVQAGGVVCSGIEVENPPRTTILTISYKHLDKNMVQPILEALIKTYERKHLELRVGVGLFTEYYQQQAEYLRRKLAGEEAQLKELKAGNVLSAEDNRSLYKDWITKAREDLLTAQNELAECTAIGNVPTPGETNSGSAAIPPPPEKVSDYSALLQQLDVLKKRVQELRFDQQLREAHPAVQTVRTQIEQIMIEKKELERAFPALAQVHQLAAGEGTNSPAGTLTKRFADIKNLEVRVRARSMILSNIMADFAKVMESEPKIAELQRQHEEDRRNYDFVLTRLDQVRGDQSRAAGPMLNMRVVQNPTPPRPDNKKLMRLMGMVFAGCAGLGLGLAFVIDLVLDRTIRRSADVERLLRLPVMLVIPDIAWRGRWHLPWPRRRRHARLHPTNGEAPGGKSALPLAPWDPGSHLQTYTDGLRERLLTWFEINHLNLKKPKLVGVAGCGEGAGVSTLASGLAAALSKTGDGNVLLVDMNGDHDSAHLFQQGKPACALSDALEPEARAEAQVQENLYLVSLHNGDNSQPARMLPARFTRLVPKLKASDYDFIIFDMPPVSQTSPTPRLASQMDIVLLVLESEKTGQQSASRAKALMRESRANVATVLNKYRHYVPARLAEDL